MIRIGFSIVTLLAIFGLEVGAAAAQQIDPNGVNYVGIEVCGDVAGKDPRPGCIKVERYLWGPVGEARLVPSQTLRSTGKTEAYDLVVDSRGCFPVHSAARDEGTYSLNARFSVLKGGTTTIHVDAHPVVQEVVDEIEKNRDAPQLMGRQTCQAVVVK